MGHRLCLEASPGMQLQKDTALAELLEESKERKELQLITYQPPTEGPRDNKEGNTQRWGI